MSLPTSARFDETVLMDSQALVCPRCQSVWKESDAPAACPNDGASLIRARELLAGKHDPMVGRNLENRYTIHARLGSGSMGTVYRAKQHAMGREVAIKILRGDRAADDVSKARFLREARANSLLASPNTVTVFDFGQSESGEFYIAMELLEGESLGQRLARLGRLPIAVAVDAARQTLRSLSEAHAKGIIHRDLKPDNLFFARVMGGGRENHDEIVKVLDFGIAKMVSDDPGGLGVIETQAGTVFGTPRYMSPEQAQGKTLDPRTDLYSLGVILYQMVTGEPPFTDNDAVVVMARHIKSPPKRPSEVNPEAAIPKELEDVILRTLSKDPTQRQASAEVLAGELLAALEAQGPNASGVRSSLTNVAGIRLPDSMRPAPTPLPQKRSRLRAVLLWLAVLLVSAVAAAGVYIGMQRAKHPAVPPAPRVDPPIASSAPPKVAPPTVSLDALPSAQPLPQPPPPPSAKPSATTSPPKPPRTRTPRAPSNGPRTPNTSAPTATPAPTPSYGVFE